MKVYDCFTFFNELDLLELRLSELDSVVDYFVISEANKKHNGEPKEFLFEKNRKRYKKWENKIIYIKVNLPSFNLLDKLLIFFEKTIFYKSARWITVNFGLGRWRIENYQRNAIRDGLKNCSKEDLIMVSDLDEIPRPNKVLEAKRVLPHSGLLGFEQKVYYYYLNGLVNQKWIGTKACSFYVLNKMLNLNPQSIRVLPFLARVFNKLFKRNKSIIILKDGGWHFSYLGGLDKIIEKRKSLAHTEISSDKFLKKSEIYKDIKRGVFKTKDLHFKIKYVNIDKDFPAEISKNKAKYKKFIFK